MDIYTKLAETNFDEGQQMAKLKASAGCGIPENPNPKEISDLLQKIHAVYAATITDEITVVRYGCGWM